MSSKEDVLRLLSDGSLSPQEAVNRYAESSKGRIYVRKDKAQIINAYEEEKAIREEAWRRKLTFLHPHFLPNFYLARGITNIGAVSGQSKSTTCANMAAAVLEYNPGIKVMIISNEENSDAIYQRIACMLLRKNYKDFSLHKMSEEDRFFVEDTVLSVMDSVEVVSNSDTWSMNDLSDLKAVMEAADRDKVDILFIDYLQNIDFYTEKPDTPSVDISKKFGFFLKNFSMRSPMPIVVFSQLKLPGDNKGMKDRIENDRTFFNHCFINIEIVPDFEKLETTFKIHKDRVFYCTGKTSVMKFVNGRYETIF